MFRTSLPSTSLLVLFLVKPALAASGPAGSAPPLGRVAQSDAPASPAPAGADAPRGKLTATAKSDSTANQPDAGAVNSASGEATGEAEATVEKTEVDEQGGANAGEAAPAPASAAPASAAPVPAPVPRIDAEDDYENAPPPGKESGPSAAPAQATRKSPAPAEQKQEKPRFDTLILAEAVAKYGSVGDSSDSAREDREAHRAGMFGGQVTLGLMPGGKYFTMAARLSGGAFVGGPSAQGTIGAAMMFGANFLRNEKGDTYSYALGGAGVEFMPGINQDMLALHLAGGTVVKTMSFSAGIDIGGNEEYGFALFGMQLGWGHLY